MSNVFGSFPTKEQTLLFFSPPVLFKLCFILGKIIHYIKGMVSFCQTAMCVLLLRVQLYSLVPTGKGLPVCLPQSRGNHVKHVPFTPLTPPLLVLLLVRASPPFKEHITLSAWEPCASCFNPLTVSYCTLVDIYCT